jgi:hypothetical protein
MRMQNPTATMAVRMTGIGMPRLGVLLGSPGRTDAGTAAVGRRAMPNRTGCMPGVLTNDDTDMRDAGAVDDPDHAVPGCRRWRR